MSDLQLIFNKETGKWERIPEPYLTIQIATQADFEELKAAVEFYKNRDKYVEQRHERWENGRCTGCGAREGIENIGFNCVGDVRVQYRKSDFCFHCGAKMDLKP